MTTPSPTTPDALATEVSFRPFALGGATATFALIGATSSLYGPLLVSFSHRFHLSLPSAGAVLSMHFVGALFGVLLAWIGVKRFSGALVLSVALLLMAGGAVGAALSHDWNVFLACVLLIGLGYGGLDFALNTLLTRTAARGRALRLSVTNAGFGVGAVIGPLLIVTLRPQNFPHLFAGIAVAAFGTVAVANHAQVPHGLPLAGVLVVFFLVILTFLAKRTTFGRHVYAVGGNAEAARRAGINVPRIRILVFMISSAMAAVGGIILAANVNSVDLNFGGGTLLLNAIAAAVIGGVSLFGGRGEVRAAFLGALVIATVSNGLNTAGYATGIIYMVTGVILLFAVTLDTIARRLQLRSGR